MLGRKTVGYITAHIRPQAEFYKVKKVGTISGLMVQKEHRRSRIGTRLLAKAQAFFKEHGIRYFTVYTAVTNDSALRFYEINDMDPLNTTLIGEMEVA
jgi:ribosomal protein S18 acetylase RimI-like enzyme